MLKNVIAMILMVCSLLVISACTIMAGNKIAVISLNGPIQAEAYVSLFGSSGITPALVRHQLERASDDFEVKAIVIQVNSPGGDVSACEEIRYEMEKIEKPMVISMRTIAASGGYYISAGADRIVALPTTNTGSIGVITHIPNLKGLFDKLGIKMEIVKSGKYKDMYSGFKELTPEEIQIVQKNADQAYDRFIDIVARGRNLDKEKVREIATGQLYTGLDAKELGLVDEIGGLQTAIDLAAKLADIEKPRVEYYETDSTDLLKILMGFNSGVFNRVTESNISGFEGMIIQELLGNTYPKYYYR